MNNHGITATHNGGNRGGKVLRNVVFHCVLLFSGGIVFGASSTSTASSLRTEAVSPLPNLTVPSNGVTYSNDAGITSDTFHFKVFADAGFFRKIKDLKYRAGANVGFTGGVSINVGLHSDSLFIPLFKKRKDSLNGHLSMNSAALATACNVHAGKLRDEGLTNTQIFGQDRILTVHIGVQSEMDVVASSFEYADLATFELDLLCKQWGGVQDQGQATQLNPQHGVHNAELALVEESNIAGLCRVKLNSTIETTEPLTEVRFRYQHDDGQQSDIKTITTSDSGLALVTHTISIPNGPEQETGTMRIVGVSPSFTSNTVAYSMNCSGSGTALQLSLAPTALLQGTPIGLVQRPGQTCPTHLNLQGAISGHGSGTTTGTAYFQGPQVESPIKAFNVSSGQSVYVNHLVPLTWSSEPLLTNPQAGLPPLMSQSVAVGFNVLGENDIEIAQVPQRTFQIACNQPSSMPAVPSEPAAPPTAAVAIPEPTSAPVRPTNKKNSAPNTEILLPSLPVEPSASAQAIGAGLSRNAPSFPAAPAGSLANNIRIGKADLMATTLGLTLAGGVHGWGTTVVLNNPNSAVGKGLGPNANLCRFSQSAYRPFNSGAVTSGFFNATVSRNNQQMHSSTFNLPPTSGLPGNGWHKFNLDLAQGMNTIQVKLDPNNSVSESNENNNLYNINVQVNFPCTNVGQLIAPTNAIPANSVPVPSKPQRTLPQNNNIKASPSVKPKLKPKTQEEGRKLKSRTLDKKR